MAFFNIIIFTPCQKLICWLRYLSICTSKINNDFCEWNYLFWKEFSYYILLHMKSFLRIRFMKKRLHHINSTQSRKQIPKNEIFFRARKKAWSIDHFNFQLNERCSDWIYLIQKNYFNQNVKNHTYVLTTYISRCLIY